MTQHFTATAADRRSQSWAGVERRRAARRLGRIDVFENPSDAIVAWEELETVAPASIYQTRGWLAPWIDTVGRANGVLPMIVVARATNGSPVALFPFGVTRRGRVRIAGFLGGRDSNTNVGLLRHGVSLDRSDILSVLRAATARSSQRPDAFVLSNQPESWNGESNPLALIERQASPSECHSARLGANGEAFLKERLSTDTRRKLRKKRKKLSDHGEVSHVVARTPAEVERIIAAFFTQKLERFRQKNIASEFETRESRDFLTRACLAGLDSGHPTLELHALTAGERIVAVYAGAEHRGRFHAMVNSYDSDPDIARCSPGDLLLMAMMKQMCERGLVTFDLGVGEARYKSSWCDVIEPLFDTLHGVTLKGRIFVLAESARRRVKRYVKRNAFAWTAFQRLRQGLG